MNFSDFVKRNRGQAVCHILTLIEYWLAEGAEEFTERKRPGFEDWARKVGGVLQACGVGGFLDYTPPVVANTDEAEANEFLCGFTNLYGRDSFQPSNAVVDWAADAGFGIVDGFNLDQRKANLRDTLPAFAGRKFKFEEELCVFKSEKKIGTGVVGYSVSKVELREK
jgi:hypothetical protein